MCQIMPFIRITCPWNDRLELIVMACNTETDVKETLLER